MVFLQWLMGHWAEAIGALNGVLVALIGVCLLIPGEQPEKTLQKIVDVLSGLSRK